MYLDATAPLLMSFLLEECPLCKPCSEKEGEKGSHHKTDPRNLLLRQPMTPRGWSWGSLHAPSSPRPAASTPCLCPRLTIFASFPSLFAASFSLPTLL